MLKLGLLGMGVVGGGVYELAKARDDMDVKYVLDERIVDGYYYAAFFKHFRSILRRPEILDVPPQDLVSDIE